MRAIHLVTSVLVTGVWLVSCAKKENNESALASITTAVATASELPACSPESTAQVYWVEDQSKLFVCNGATFVEIKGDKGEQGEKGDTGDTGTTGPAGSPANSGVWVFDKNSKPIGVLMDAGLGLIMFTNGAFARIDLNTGNYKLPVYITGNGVMDVSPNIYVCAMTEVTCGGTCYTDKLTPRGTIMRTAASTYFVATGDEQLVNGAIVRGGSNPDGTCSDLGGDTPFNGYPINKVYAFPEGITLPLQTPLSFGFKTEE